MDDQIEMLYSTGLSVTEIAERLGVSVDYVMEAVKRMGLDEY